jgi:hypothetical protein
MRDRDPAPRPRTNSVEERPAMISIGREGAVGTVAPEATPPSGSDIAGVAIDASLPAAPEFPGVLLLADGQRLRGDLDLRSAAPVWRSPWLAQRTLAAEGLRAIVLDDAAPPAAVDADAVRLRNGDLVTGIVLSMNAEGVEIERGSGTERTTVRLPFDRIRSIAFVAPPQPPTGTRIWLADGSVVDAPAAEWMNADYLRAPGVEGRQPGQPATFPRNAVLAVRRAPDAVQPLAARTPEVAAAADGLGLRYSLTPPRARAGEWAFDAPPLEIEGPVKLSYPAPTTPVRLLATAVRAAAPGTGGELVLVVRSDGTELARERLDAQRARLPLRVDLPAAPFELELLAADGSAAGDLMVLERAVLVPTGGAGAGGAPTAPTPTTPTTR